MAASKKKIRIYPCVLYFMLERWLTKMSMCGWHLKFRKFGFVYFFEKGMPEQKEYFVWDPTYTGEGKYSIANRYPSLIKTYGKSNSPLNKNSTKNHDTIIEIDIRRIDVNNNLSYLELKHDRNRLYAFKFMRNFVLFLIVIVTIVIVFVVL